jgi:hypothetical protein
MTNLSSSHAGMTIAPVPNEAKAATIRRDHPQHIDASMVTYSWRGLRFPIPPVEDWP